VIPHRWDGVQWTCLQCGEVRPDPCTCPCHVYTILVTGSRNWPDPRKVFTELAAFRGAAAKIIVRYGAAYRGADRYAAASALSLGFARDPRPANWKVHGQARAGFIRNAEMVKLGADVCLAFIAPCIKTQHKGKAPHGSHGSVQCAGLAEQAGIPVRRFLDGWSPPPDQAPPRQEPLLQLPLPLPDLHGREHGLQPGVPARPETPHG
jgi:hypothetical protein